MPLQRGLALRRPHREGARLHLALRNKPYETRRALVISLVLISLGVLGTFPLFFQAFSG